MNNELAVYSGTMYKGDKVLRETYARHHRVIETGRELRETLRAGPYAFPGWYALAFVTNDGDALCFQCVMDNYRFEVENIRGIYPSRIVGTICEAETDSECYCATGALIWEAKD